MTISRIQTYIQRAKWPHRRHPLVRRRDALCVARRLARLAAPATIGERTDDTSDALIVLIVELG